MQELITLVTDILPLYLIVGIGYFAGRRLGINRDTIAPLLIYIISPAVIFYGVATAPIQNQYLLLPVVFYAVGLFLSFVFYEIGKLFWPSTNEKNLLSASAGSGNTGYFGLPLVLAITGEAGLSIAVFCLIGSLLYEATRVYYVIARGHATAKEAAIRALRMPIIYAFTLGLIANRLGVQFGGGLDDAFGYFKGAYVVFGMMIIGVVLATTTRAAFDLKFTVLAFIAKFLCLPLLIGAFVLLDSAYFHMFDSLVHTVMLILSIVPMAANMISYATLLKAHPQKVALTVIASTIFALVYIPVFVSIFLR